MSLFAWDRKSIYYRTKYININKIFQRISAFKSLVEIFYKQKQMTYDLLWKWTLL